MLKIIIIKKTVCHTIDSSFIVKQCHSSQIRMTFKIARLCDENIPPHQTNYVPDMNITELLPADTMQKLRPTAATQSVPYIHERDFERVFIQFSMWTDGD